MRNFKGMTYTERKDGRFAKSVVINGKTIYLCEKNIETLYKKYLDAKTKDLKGISLDSNLKFGKYAERWKEINSAGKAPATIKEYNYIINKYLIPYFGFYNINKITRIQIQQLQADLLINGHYELSNKCIRFMNAIFEDMIVNNLISSNPCKGLKKSKIEHKERKILSQKEDLLLLESEHKYKTFFKIMRYTGLRREEIAALKKSDIDLKRKIITVQRAFDYSHNQPTVKSTKNKKIRKVPILEIIYTDFKEIVENCETEYLFNKESGGPLTAESFRNRYKSFCKSTGIQFTPHELRHSFCTSLYYSGITIKEAMRIMGHSSSDMILEIYAHLDELEENSQSKINSYIQKKFLGRKLGNLEN